GFALELVQADAYARHFRLLGDDVNFHCGTDDNSLKNVRSAEAAGGADEFLVGDVEQAAKALEHVCVRIDEVLDLHSRG
ncbi:class I tRNA ligase family protein, partial [Rhizobium ruizarguesonis]